MILHLPLFCVFYDYNFRKGKANRFVFVETKMQKVAVSNIAKQIRGVSYKPVDLHNDLNKDSVILLRANNISDGKINFDDVVYVDKKKVSSEQYLQKGDILICASSGSKNLVGKAASVSFDIKCTFGAFCKVIRPISKYANYLGMYFQSDIYRRIISNVAIGANINNIRNEHIDSLELSIYSDNKNNEIVSLLDTLQSIITHRRTQLEKLDLLVKARFVEMFGDIYTNKYDLPICPLSDYITFLTSGSRGWAKYCTENGTDWFITIKNVKACKITTHNIQQLNAPDNMEAKRTKVQEDDLLISITADLGRTGVVTKEIAEHGAYINQHLTCVRLNKSKITPIYAAYFMESNSGRPQFEAKNQTGVKAGLNFDSIKSLKISVPPLTLQNQFADFVKQIDKSKSILQQELDKAQMLFDSLMQEYFG